MNNWRVFSPAGITDNMKVVSQPRWWFAAVFLKWMCSIPEQSSDTSNTISFFKICFCSLSAGWISSTSEWTAVSAWGSSTRAYPDKVLRRSDQKVSTEWRRGNKTPHEQPEEAKISEKKFTWASCWKLTTLETSWSSLAAQVEVLKVLVRVMSS